MSKGTLNGSSELHGYEILHLAQAHSAILPTGETVELPAGTRLVMRGKGDLGLRYLGSADSAPIRPPAGKA